eukprot:TRINITY_DN10506_c0_g1_i1.p1 TRINITY_DN10506_c0_g1~~TRINITY_DN10506_c0_g1_i1.p1  ORF type:complete len:365 (-),score=100.97 TRINITY_DN10506_c0_g1_i1:255-1349(-)
MGRVRPAQSRSSTTGVAAFGILIAVVLALRVTSQSAAFVELPSSKWSGATSRHQGPRMAATAMEAAKSYLTDFDSQTWAGTATGAPAAPAPAAPAAPAVAATGTPDSALASSFLTDFDTKTWVSAASPALAAPAPAAPAPAAPAPAAPAPAAPAPAAPAPAVAATGTAAPAPANSAPRIAPLFQELNVSNTTQPKSLMKAIVAVFNRGERAVDLVLIDPRAKSTMMYAIALIPDAFDSAAQLLMRRRDRRLRIRVLQHFRPKPDEEAEVMRISSQVNITRVSSAMMSKFVDLVGNNMKRTVKVQFQGRAAAANALMTIEQAGQKAHREFTFSPRFVKTMVPAEDEAEGAQGQMQVSFLVTVVAT